MKIEIRNEDVPESQRDTRFQRLVISFDAGGQRKTIVSKVITSNSQPGEMAATLREIARGIDQAAGFVEPQLPPDQFTWVDFMNAVHRTDRFIEHNVVWRTDFSARQDPPTCPPTFEFLGWRVYKPR
jgi:hypothetical protein